jgi:6-phosphogluconolactonase
LIPHSFSRRRFLAASAALPFAMRALADPLSSGSHWVLFGTGTDKGIFRATFDSSTGTLSAFEVAAETSHPTYLALHPTLPLLYAANEIPDGDGEITSFKLERRTGELEALSQATTDGNGPCYLSIDATGKCIYAANYGGGTVTSLDLIRDGEFDHATVNGCNTNLTCGVPGPLKPRQNGTHMHCAVISPDNHFMLACDLGEDVIHVIPISPGHAAANFMDPTPDSPHKPAGPPRGPHKVATRPGSGPRHVVFHPNGHHVYCIYELDCTLELFDWSVYNGYATLKARPESVVSSLPAGVSANAASDHPSTACELAISPNGKSLYANTRGANTLAVYDIAHDGLLTEQQRINTGGDNTRHFAFDPSRRWLLCANQGSSTVTVFSHDTSTGKLGEKPQTFPLDTPMFVQFL